MLRSALSLAARGLSIFPCQPQGKTPACRNGCKDATRDRDVIEAWWHRNPAFNIAIATGEASGVFVVDIDGLDAEAELRKLEAEHGELPASVEAITARGRHIYFCWADRAIKNSTGLIAPGIDVRGAGGYTLAPPSIHPSGRRYEWSVDSASEFAPAPEWLLNRVRPCSKTERSNGRTPPSEWRELIKAGVDEGARDATITKITGHLLRRFVDPVVVLDLMQSWNLTHSRPPLPTEDVDRIVNSIAGKELLRRHG